jgi:hypothetical protein
MVSNLDSAMISIILGVLAAIVYSLRVLILLERRIARMDNNIGILTKKILAEELKIEKLVTRKKPTKKKTIKRKKKK